MDTELLSDDMVTQLRQQINRLAQQSAHQETGAAQLDAFEQGLRQTLNRLGAELMQRQVASAAQAREKGPQTCASCGATMRNVKRAPLTVQSIFGPLRIRRTHFCCPSCQQSFYPLDAFYDWSKHRFTPTAKEWVCLMTQAHAYDTAAQMLGRVSGMETTVETLRDVTQECGIRLLERRQAAVRVVNESDEPLPQQKPAAKWMLVGVDGCQVLKSGEGVGKRKKRKKRAKNSQNAVRKPPGVGAGTAGAEVPEGRRERGMEVKVGVVGVL